MRFSPHTFTTQFVPAFVPDVLELTFSTDTGRTYRLEYATEMNPATWIPTGLVIDGTGGPVRAHDPAGSALHKIYRIVLD